MFICASLDKATKKQLRPELPPQRREGSPLYALCRTLRLLSTLTSGSHGCGIRSAGPSSTCFLSPQPPAAREERRSPTLPRYSVPEPWLSLTTASPSLTTKSCALPCDSEPN